jgi:hypothetical protein
VLRHQLGQNFVLRLDLLLQVCNPLLVSGMVGWPFLLEGSSPILKEFLLPAVEDCRLESHLITQLRDGSSTAASGWRPSLLACIASVASSCVLSLPSWENAFSISN